MNCLICKKENDNYLCPECRAALREQNAEYSDYLNALLHLADDCEESKRDYITCCILTNDYPGVHKERRQWLYDTFKDKCLDEYSLDEQLKIKGWLLDALYQDYQYDEADQIASELLMHDDIPYTASLALGDFYTKTRRYDIAGQVLKASYQIYAFDEAKGPRLAKLIDDNVDRFEKSFKGKGEYMPNPKENRDEIRKKYVDFLATLGINALVPQPIPKPIKKEDYPPLTVIENEDFDSFVAFDFETTGFSSVKDSIIEIGAIKVIDGKVDDSKEYIFSEFVKPFKSRVSEDTIKVTGIRPEDVKDARNMWEVVSDFLDFVGDLPLVGYNNARFDNGFLERGGRYCNRIIKNPTFDVYTYAKQNKDKFSTCGKYTLTDVSEALGIINENTHRAYFDAITTAKVFLVLKR